MRGFLTHSWVYQSLLENVQYPHKERLFSKCLGKKYAMAGCWWLMPVILATQEAEIRRTVVQSQDK
jgi:hypothetical protein